jgi:hypothetical protein
MFIHWRSDGQMGNRTQCSHIKDAVVCRAVRADYSCPVQTEDDGQIQNSQIMDDIIISPLGESTVDVTERLKSVLCHPPREGDGMLLGNSHIEHTVRHDFLHDIHGAPGGHGRGHPHNPGVTFSQFKQRFSEHLLEFWRLVSTVLDDPVTGLDVKFPGGMPDGGRFLSRFVTLSLDGVEVQ